MHIRKIYSRFAAETREKWGDRVITGDVRVRKGRNSPNDPGVSVNEGFLKVYPALRNVIRSFSLPPSLSLFLPAFFFSYPSLIFSVCPSFAPSAPSATSSCKVCEIYSIYFLFFSRRVGIRTEQREETYVLFREERTTASRRTSWEEKGRKERKNFV